MSLLKALVVLFLTVAGSYGHSQIVSEKESKWTADRGEAPRHNARINRFRYRNRYFVPEIKYRLDQVPCYHTAMPPDNKVFHYSARVVRRSLNSYQCIAYILRTRTLLSDINGTIKTYYLESPRLGSRYPSRRLSFYHIKCETGEEIKFHVKKFNLQDKIRTIYNDQRKCVDYVKIQDLIQLNKHGEFCGTRTDLIDKHTNYSNNVLVTFRSSGQNNDYKGFEIRASCNRGSQSMEKCLKVKDVEYAGQTTEKSVPKYALQELQRFLHSREFEQGESVWMMSDDEAVWNTDILSLAVLSEHSCAAEYWRAGKAVLKLFPQWIVKKERENYKKDGAVLNMVERK